MTRINSAIPVKCLTDEHLLAEHREIKRLTYNLKQAIKSGSIKRIPNKFTLGTGHVIFFLNKMRFTYNRYCNIKDELINRGFSVMSFYSNWDNIPNEYYNDYEPTLEERQLLIERIKERILKSPKETWHYYGHEISRDDAIKRLTNDFYYNNPNLDINHTSLFL